MKKKKKWKTAAGILILLALLCAAIVFGTDFWVKHSVKDRILSEDEAAGLEDVDCILVLGAGVWDGGVPSPMLQDRLEQGIALYQKGAAPKLLMSGDHGRKEYDEVNVMKQYAADAGVPSSDVFMDHAGFSTYESMYRARDVFQVKRMLVVTQGYHMYRALYAAEKLGIEAWGVNADPRTYAGQAYRDLREILARNKDFWTLVFQPAPSALGEPVPISGDGDETND